MNRRSVLKAAVALPLFPAALLAQSPQPIEGKVIGGAVLGESDFQFYREIIQVYPDNSYASDNDIVNVNNFAREMLKLHPTVELIELIIQDQHVTTWKKEDGKWWVKGNKSSRFFPVNLQGKL
jgi:hypothetical protein